MDKEELYNLYIEKNLTNQELAKRLNCGVSTIRRWLKKYDIKKPSNLKFERIKQTCLLKYGIENPSQSKEIQEKKKQTCLKHYGVNHPSQSDIIKEKKKQTCLRHYGVECSLQSEEIKNRIKQTCLKYYDKNEIQEKRKQTCLKRYGKDNISQLKEIKEKKKQKFLERYGVENPSQSKEIQERKEQTCLKHYGKKNSLQVKEIQEKIKQTCLKKYGVENPLQSQKVKNKSKQTNLEKYGVEYSSQKHLSKETLEILSDKEKLKDFILNSENKNGFYLAEKLKVNRTGFYRKLHDYGLYDLLDHSSSSYEQEIKEYYNNKGIKLEKTRKELDGLEIDLYNPIHKIGIEFNGDYWHSERFLDKFYHQKKSLIAESKGITLFHIWEYEWIFNRDKILMMLDNLFGLSESIYARNCKIVEIPYSDKSKFLNENHLQGNDKSTVNLALVNNNILVSVMTFCKPRFNKNYEYELSRFCNLKNTRVVGGASKLFKYFIQKYKPKSVISYSNISKTTGNMYSKLKFKLERISEPNYVWIDSKMDIKSRYQCQMKNEKQIMTDKGYFRIYDCGNKVWIYYK